MNRIAFAFVLLLAFPAAAVTLDDMVLSDSASGKPMKVFKPATEKIFLVAKVKDPAVGDVVKAEWIADKAEGAPANYRIDKTELKLKKESTGVTFSMSKPNKGWPVGTYHAEVSINGKVTAKVPFSVEK